MLEVVLKDLRFHKQSFELNEYDKDTRRRRTKNNNKRADSRRNFEPQDYGFLLNLL